jgi:hypothetical protein
MTVPFTSESVAEGHPTRSPTGSPIPFLNAIITKIKRRVA